MKFLADTMRKDGTGEEPSQEYKQTFDACIKINVQLQICLQVDNDVLLLNPVSNLSRFLIWYT